MTRMFFAVAVLAALGVPAYSQNASLPRNDKILIDYQDALDPETVAIVDPSDQSAAAAFAKFETYRRLVERLKERKVLERYAQFLVPLKLPTTLRLVAKQCNTVNAFYDSAEKAIFLCYEYVKDLEDNAPEKPGRISRDDAIVGGLISVLLHETGHAIFNIFKIPVLAREEDAADQVAAFVMLQFGEQVAQTVVKGSIWGYNSTTIFPSKLRSTATLMRSYYSDTHSTNEQRLLTFLCIAYGAKPKEFQQFIDAGYLSAARAATCNRDYQQIERAFTKTVLPHIDKELMAKVQGAQWLFPQDMGLIPVQTR